MSEPLLILIDYQKGLCASDSPFGGELAMEVARRGVLAAASTALDRFREQGLPVAHVRVAFDDHYSQMTSASKSFAKMRDNRLLLESDPASEICGEVAPLPGELVITKGCTDAFIGTNLAAKLASLRPTQLVIGGVATNIAVEATARHATDTGYEVVVLEDLCASFSEDMHLFSVERILPRYTSVMSSQFYFAQILK